MICFLGSILSVAILELSIEVSNSLMEVCTRCSKILSKVFVKKRLEALVHVCDEAHITKQGFF